MTYILPCTWPGRGAHVQGNMLGSIVNALSPVLPTKMLPNCCANTSQTAALDQSSVIGICVGDLFAKPWRTCFSRVKSRQIVQFGHGVGNTGCPI